MTLIFIWTVVNRMRNNKNLVCNRRKSIKVNIKYTLIWRRDLTLTNNSVSSGLLKNAVSFFFVKRPEVTNFASESHRLYLKLIKFGFFIFLLLYRGKTDHPCAKYSVPTEFEGSPKPI